MGSVYRKSYTKPLPAGAETFERKGVKYASWKDAKGKKQTGRVVDTKDGSERVTGLTATYYASYRDGTGNRRVVSTECKSKDGALSVLTDLEKRAEKQRSGILSTADAEAADYALASLVDVIADYKMHLDGRGRSKQYRDEIEATLKKIAASCRWNVVRDLCPKAAERYLVNLRDDEALTRSARTLNRQAGYLRSFGNWLLKSGRTVLNPFAALPSWNVDADRRHIRRALSPAELAALLEATEARPVNDLRTVRTGKNAGKLIAKVKAHHLEAARRIGRERALFYRLLAFSGLRANEGRKLRIGDLHLDGPKPSIALRAETEKNRRGATVPLRDDLAADLAGYLRERKTWAVADSVKRGKPCIAELDMAAPVFPNPPMSVKVFDRDLVAAGLATRDKETGIIHKLDSRGRTLDIHSLRGTYASMLGAAGVPLATAQVLMRHSTPVLTAKHYIDPAMLDTAGAVSNLPTMAEMQAAKEAHAKAQAKAVNETRDLAHALAHADGKSCASGALDGKAGGLNRTWASKADTTGIASIDGDIRSVASRGKENKMVTGPGLKPGTTGLKA